jgi:SpoVK/Ycf46/Vps4 family AAA+-type ATPase
VALDPSLVASLEGAVARDPDALPLRLHVARLYLEASQGVEALTHAEAALARAPANTEALDLAARAADLVGQTDRAAGLRVLLDALGQASATTAGAAEGGAAAREAAAREASPREAPPAGAAPAPTTAAVPVADGLSSVSETDLDAFLEEVLGADPDVERPRVTLDDVGGLEDVKKRLRTSFLGPMRNPELRRMYGKSLRGGLLLYGPPGCGKTFLARAVAGELGAKFFGVGLHDILDMWLGKSEQNLHAIFETARRHTPCVLFLDEVDALGMKRTNLSHSAGRNVVVQLLSELDSTRNDNEGVFVLGATNQPWDIDPALRRPGRFDRMLLVLPPDSPARAAIVRYHLRDRPVHPKVDPVKLAARTDGYSGADLRLLCESAAEAALEASMETGTPRPIGPADFEAALAEVKPSTRPWFEVARNHALFANEGGVYDELLAYMRRHRLA